VPAITAFNRDPKGKFHVIPHDTNETFAPLGFGFGPGFGKGPPGGFGKGPKEGPGGKAGASAYALDPLIGLNNVRTPCAAACWPCGPAETLPRTRAHHRRGVVRLEESSGRS